MHWERPRPCCEADPADDLRFLPTIARSLCVASRAEKRLLAGPDAPGPEPADKADQEPATREGTVSAAIEIDCRL